MEKYILGCCALLITGVAFAGYSGGHTVGRVSVSQGGEVSFGTSTQAANTCNFYHFHLKFDSNTKGGKSMLSLLLSAKVSKSKIDVWYAPSSTPGADHTSGCTNSTMAVVRNIGLQ